MTTAVSFTTVRLNLQLCHRGDSKRSPVALKVFEKPFGFCAMGVAVANKDRDVRSRVSGRDSGSGDKQKWDEEPTQPANEPLQEACARHEHNVVLADNVRWRHGSDV
jgi:hypothetical protein